MDCHASILNNKSRAELRFGSPARKPTCKRSRQQPFKAVFNRFWLCLPICLILYSTQGFAGFLETLIVPHEFNLSWVTRSAIQNGHRVEVVHFHTSQKPDDVIEHFRQVWIGRGNSGIPDFVEEIAGKWKIISTISVDKQLVLQVTKGREGATRSFASGDNVSSVSLAETSDEDKGSLNAVAVNSDGSSGFISSMELDAVVSVPRHQLPEPAGSSTVSITNSDEAGVLKEVYEQNATTAILVNPDSVNSIYRFYQKNMQSSGWVLVAGNSNQSAAALMYQRNGKKCEISLVSLGANQTLITLSYTG